MRKFDIFIKGPRQKKWRASGTYVLASNIKEAAKLASNKFSGMWVKPLPAIVFI